MRIFVVDQFGSSAIRERLTLTLDMSSITEMGEFTLEDYALAHNSSGFLGIMQDEGSSVDGVLLDISGDDLLEFLDYFYSNQDFVSSSKLIDNEMIHFYKLSSDIVADTEPISDDKWVSAWYDSFDSYSDDASAVGIVSVVDVDDTNSDEFGGILVDTSADAADEEVFGAVAEGFDADEADVEVDEEVSEANIAVEADIADTEADEAILRVDEAGIRGDVDDTEVDEEVPVTDVDDTEANEEAPDPFSGVLSADVDDSEASSSGVLLTKEEDAHDMNGHTFNFEALPKEEDHSTTSEESKPAKSKASQGHKSHKSAEDLEIDLFAEYKVTEKGWWSGYKVALVALAACFVLVVGFGAYMSISYNISGLITKDLGEEVASQVTTVPAETTRVTTQATNFNGEIVPELVLPDNVTEPEDSLNLLYVNFDELREKYPDVVGWLSVPGAGITQPVAQTSNNEYYLTHNIDKTLSKSGWIFADYRLRNELPVRNYVIYGHNMADGTAFGRLNRVRFDSDSWHWWEQEDCQYIYYTTEYYTAVYQIFNVMQVVSSEVYYHNLSINSSAMPDFMTEMSGYNMCADKLTYSQPFKESDRLITLSTCADAEGAEKLVIQGVLVYSKQLKDVEVISMN